MGRLFTDPMNQALQLQLVPGGGGGGGGGGWAL
jgi:hypothetical protein